MPGGDCTGPRGLGPHTGWGYGHPAPRPEELEMTRNAPQHRAGWGRKRGGQGRGRCLGSGSGRGWRGRYFRPEPSFAAAPAEAPLAPSPTLADLQHTAELLKKDLETINQQIAQLEQTE